VGSSGAFLKISSNRSRIFSRWAASADHATPHARPILSARALSPMMPRPREASTRERMKVGVFDHLDRNDRPLHAFYEERLKIVEAYDRGGFYAYHTAEHHATPLGLAASPSVFLAAVAQRTQRLRFGPLVYTLPLHHPLRVVEEICMLDQISRGRFELGVGRGISPIETAYYGVKPDDRQKMYLEALQILR